MINNYNLKNDMDNKIVHSLKNLPRISAPEDFEIKLKHRINTLPPPVKRKKFFTFNLNRTLIPAFGLLASLILVFSLFYYQNIFEVKNTSVNSSSSQKEDKTLAKPENSDIKIERENKGDFTLEAPVKVNEIPASSSTQESKERLRELISTVRGRNVDQSLRARPESSSVYGDNPAQPVQFNEYNPFLEGERILEKPPAVKDSLNKSKVKKK